MRVVMFLAMGLVGCVDDGRVPPAGGSTTSVGGKPEPATVMSAKNPNAEKHLPFVPGVVLSSSLTLLDAGVTSTAFNFTHLDTLWVRVSLPGMGRTTIVKLRLISPRGNIMYDADLPYSNDNAIEAMEMNGIEHPVRTHFAKPVPGGYHLDYSIGIAGSHITRYPEPGGWQVVMTVADTGQTFTVPIDVTIAQ